MITAKEAVVWAKQRAVEMLDQRSVNLEEIELETYKDREVWNITLSFPRYSNGGRPSELAALVTDPLQYKRFLIDAETGDLVAVKLRELAAR